MTYDMICLGILVIFLIFVFWFLFTIPDDDSWGAYYLDSIEEEYTQSKYFGDSSKGN